jgi:fumarate hydratase, class I
MSATGHRPICQDTGIVNVFLKVGMDVRWEGFTGSLDDAINEGVRRGYNHPDNTLRASVVADPQFERKNTKDNTPAVIFTEIVPGNTVEVTVAAKGGGSENKSKMVMLNPGDSVVDWVLKTVPTMGAGWCPPGMLGIGIGGTAEKAVLMAKESLMDDLDMYELQAKWPRGRTQQGRRTAPGAVREGQRAGHRRAGPGRPDHGARRQDQDVPHARGQQAGGHDPQLRRHAPRTLRAGRQRPGLPRPASLDLWPDVPGRPTTTRARRWTSTPSPPPKWRAGSRATPCCSTARCSPAATPRTSASRTCWPRASRCRWTSPTASSTTWARSTRSDEAVGPAGPTTATRMDGFTEMMLAQTGLIAMVGKAERGPVAIEAIKKHKSAYLMAVGGAAYLVSKAIKTAKVVGFADLGMEAIYEFDVVDMPVTVAVDAGGTSAHITGPAEWQKRIAGRVQRHPGGRCLTSGVHTIGVFDSGVGGLSVLRALLAEIPAARFVYVADSAYAPYGERGAEEVIERSQRITAQLRSEYPLEAMVVACNTATAHAIDTLRTTHPDLPFIGVEPALKPAVALSRTRHIGVMATRGTLTSARFQKLQARLEHAGTQHPPHFHRQACDGLADAIERGDAALTRTLCERYVSALQAQAPTDAPIDTLVLGCTHYPFEAPLLQSLCGPEVHLVETGAPVARRTREVLNERRLAPAHASPELVLLTTGAARSAQRSGCALAGHLRCAVHWTC